MNEITPTKRCSKCGIVYPATLEFFQSQKRSNGKPGLHSWCKKCKQEDQRKRYPTYYQENRETIIANARKYAIADPEKQTARHRKWYLSHKELANQRVRTNAQTLRLKAIERYGGKCACCGETHLEFLAIDHINGGGSKHRKEIGGGNIYRWLRDNGYPDGFRVLCHNCNQALGHYGYCPHQEKKT